MSLPMKWTISRVRRAPPVVERLAVPRRTTRASRRCSRSARRTRRTNNARARRGSRSRSTAPGARRPSRAEARRGNAPRGNCRSPWACGPPPCTHSVKNGCSLSIETKRWSALRISGLLPESVLFGSTSSVAAYVAPHFSQLSPYWSGAPQRGHVPLTNLSARNMPASGSKSCVTSRVETRPRCRSADQISRQTCMFASEFVLP